MNIYYEITKIFITAVIIALISIISKTSSLVGSILASIPLVSVLGIIWLYRDTKNTQSIIDLSYGVFWLVIPSLSFYLIFPYLLKKEVNFYLSLTLSLTGMIIFYFLTIKTLNYFGISI
ncbi:MAG: DUF3147 family protein [Candidatus Muiribacteriota bacterium]|jgi:hypothetical protein